MRMPGRMPAIRSFPADHPCQDGEYDERKAGRDDRPDGGRRTEQPQRENHPRTRFPHSFEADGTQASGVGRGKRRSCPP